MSHCTREHSPIFKVMAHTSMRHCTQVTESWHTWTNRGTGVKESCESCVTYEWVLVHVWTSWVTDMNESCESWWYRGNFSHEPKHIAQHTAILCYTLQHAATHCHTRDTKQTSHMNQHTLQRTVTHCNTHCNILQYTTTHCNPRDTKETCHTNQNVSYLSTVGLFS